MKAQSFIKLLQVIAFIGAITAASFARADISSAGIFDYVHHAYASVASAWAGIVKLHASRLFWTLALISMVWTFGLMALRSADASEFFAEFIRFTIFTGFYWWLLDNGAAMSATIINSLRQVGSEAAAAASAAAGHPAVTEIASPSGIVDIGFDLFGKVVSKATVWSPFSSAVAIAISIITLLVLSLVAVNMLLMLISGWILAYAGIFFLGFGGARWTSDMAIAYFKTVLGMGAQIFVMVLLVGIARTFIDTFYASMSTHLALHELAAVMVVAVILLVLINKLPGLFASLTTGGGTGALGSGASAGSAMAAAAMGAAAISAAGTALIGAAANAAGGAQALMAAVSKGAESESESSGIGRDFMAGPSGGDSQGGGNGESPLAQAMGDNSSQSTSSSFEKKNDGGSSSASSGSGQKTSSGKSGSAAGATSGGAKSSSGKSQSTSSAGTNAARVAANTASNLASGIAQLAKSSFNARVSNTVGGRVAQAIRESGSANQTSNSTNSLSAGDKADFDPNAEVASFRDRDTPDDDDPGPSKA